MKFLFFDTETSDFIQSDLPASDPRQPHLLQYAGMLLDSDRDWAEIAAAHFIVKPDTKEFTVAPSAEKAHGISKSKAMEQGVPHIIAVLTHCNLRSLAQGSVAHNIVFDRLVMDAAIHRTGRQSSLPKPKYEYCTKDLSENYVKLPPTPRMIQAGRGKQFKSPTLTELHQHLFGEGFDGAHSALEDVRACARCFVELVKREVIKIRVDTIEETM